jgi:hypothetical protein
MGETGYCYHSSGGLWGACFINSVCYMNSLLQQLFMVKPFRKSLIDAEDRSGVA